MDEVMGRGENSQEEQKRGWGERGCREKVEKRSEKGQRKKRVEGKEGKRERVGSSVYEGTKRRKQRWRRNPWGEGK
ncbi:unnamed protein product, partial [Pleuronectes platessa]